METYKSTLKVNQFLLGAIGQWPYQSNFKRQLYTFIAIISLASFFAAQVTALVRNWNDIDVIIQGFPPCFVNLMSVSCLFAPINNRHKMKLLLTKMKNDWLYWTSGEEVKILHDNAYLGRILNIVLIVTTFGVMIEYISVPLVSLLLDIVLPLNETRPKRLAIVTDYLVDIDDYYFWITFHIWYSCFVIVTTFVGVDGLFITFIYHACGQLEILGFRLRNLAGVTFYDGYEENVMQEIKFCVERHKSIIIFVNEVSECFSTSYFFAMGLNMLMMSFTGVELLINLHDPREVFACLAYIFGQMFHLLSLTLPCQRLIDNSTQLSQNIYDGYWYKTSTKSKKLLVMMITKCANPCTFTAGKLYTFSMQSFGSVLKTSVSYLTVLSSIRE